MGTVEAICTSSEKGTQKKSCAAAKLVCGHGIEGDAHAGPWHRQVSLLSYESIEAFKADTLDIPPGAFGENLVVSGVDLKALPVGTRLACGPVVLEITQIGKECHSRCAIYHQMGDCIMPREGVFARVLAPGRIEVGDGIAVLA